MKQYNGSPSHGNKNLNMRSALFGTHAGESETSGPVTPAGKYICRRFHVCPDIADLLAAHAGLGLNKRAGR